MATHMAHIMQARAPYVQELTLHMTEGWEARAAGTLNDILLSCANIHTLHITNLGGLVSPLPKPGRKAVLPCLA